MSYFLIGYAVNVQKIAIITFEIAFSTLDITK